MYAPTALPANPRLRLPFAPTRIASAMRVCLRVPPKAFGIASLSLFGAEGGAWAQQSTAPVPTLPEVRVRESDGGLRTDSTNAVTRTDTPLRDIPQFVNIVPQELIRQQNATTLQEALRNVPGISYGAAEGGTQANQVFFLRGFPLNQDIFINGVRDIGEYNRDLFATESVEVLKGSSAMLFGRGSPAGLVNQTFKNAHLYDSNETVATLGSFQQKRITADVNFRAGESGAVRLVGLAENSGSFRYPQDIEKYGFAPSFLWQISPSTQLTGSYYWFKARDVTDYGQPTLFSGTLGFWGFPDISARNYYGYEKYDYAHYETNIADLRIDHQFSPTLSINSTLRYSKYERQSESTIPSLNATDLNGDAVTTTTPLDLLRVTRNHDTNRTKDNDDDALISLTELVWTTKTGQVSHLVLGGLELVDEHLKRTNYALDADPSAPGIQPPTSVTPLVNPDPTTELSYTKSPNLEGRSKAKSVALYLQDQMQFSPEWKALLGIRWERYDAEASNTALGPNAVSSGPFQRTDNMVSGRAGLIWQPTPRQSYYVAWGNAYNPSGELGVYGGTAATNLSAINEALEPEKTQTFEVGAQWDIQSVQVRSAIFRNEKTNARMVDDTGTTVLAGKRRVEGVELEATGLLSPNWQIYSGIAYMRGEIVRGPANVQGNTPLGVPEWSGSVWSVYKLGGGWQVGGGLRGQKGTWLTDQNQPGSQIPSYVALDAMVAYLQPKWSVQINGTNLTDKTYYIGGYNNNPSRVLPGQPIAGSVTFTYQF